MHYDPFMLKIVGAVLGILAVALVSRMLRQPHVIGYLAAGVVLGPHGLAVVSDQNTLARVGDFGVLLLLFFVGMETNPRELLARWRITFVGTLVQIALSVAVMWCVGLWLDWKISRIVLMGFVISLSSTALVLNYLRETGQTDAKLGRDALGILLAQDLAVIVMLLVTDAMADGGLDGETLILQGVGSLLTLALVVWIVRGRGIRLPLAARFRSDKELQIFLAFALCLTLAFLSEAFELSASLGAFVAGMLVAASRDTEWVADRMEPFRVLFLALFFVSVGLLVQLEFVFEHLLLLAAVTFAVLFGNTLINAAIFRALGDPWRYSFYAGAHLAQIGEFSFVLAAVGVRARLITTFEYQLTLSVIVATLMLSPAWIALVGGGQNRLEQLIRSEPPSTA
ncbi:MAG: hypothetical protein JWR16_1618 [Nevskia sp.]|nr:hypothetical protein [Nevskia sp.]